MSAFSHSCLLGCDHNSTFSHDHLTVTKSFGKKITVSIFSHGHLLDYDNRSTFSHSRLLGHDQIIWKTNKVSLFLS